MTNLQLKKLFSTSEKEENPIYSEDHFSDDILQSFKKNHLSEDNIVPSFTTTNNKQCFSLDDIRNNIYVMNFSDKFQFILLFCLYSTPIFTPFFFSYSNFEYLVLLSIISTISALNYIHLNHKENKKKLFIKKFFKLEHSFFIYKMKEKLYLKLKTSNIKGLTMPSYQYLEQCIDNIDCEFDLCLINLKKEYNNQQYDFTAFINFIDYCDKLSHRLDLTNDIEFINSTI